MLCEFIITIKGLKRNGYVIFFVLMTMWIFVTQQRVVRRLTPFFAKLF